MGFQLFGGSISTHQIPRCESADRTREFAICQAEQLSPRACFRARPASASADGRSGSRAPPCRKDRMLRPRFPRTSHRGSLLTPRAAPCKRKGAVSSAFRMGGTGPEPARNPRARQHFRSSSPATFPTAALSASSAGAGPARARLAPGLQSEGRLRRGERDPSRIARLARFAGVAALSAEPAAGYGLP